MTQDYYGTKRVTAWAQVKDGEPGYAVKYSDGYTSWSPEDVFEAAYQPITSMSFGHAIAALKEGHRIARAGWNGKGMFVWMERGSVDTDPLGFAPGVNPAPNHPSTINGLSLGLFDAGDVGTITRMPYLCMRAAYGATIIGWSASQTDMLAQDWVVLDEVAA